MKKYKNIDKELGVRPSRKTDKLTHNQQKGAYSLKGRIFIKRLHNPRIFVEKKKVNSS